MLPISIALALADDARDTIFYEETAFANGFEIIAAITSELWGYHKRSNQNRHLRLRQCVGQQLRPTPALI